MSNLEEIRREVKELQKTVANAEKDKATLEGREAEVMRQLKDDYNITTMTELNNEIEEKAKELGKITDNIERLYVELKGKIK